jgi:hypothetical protein
MKGSTMELTRFEKIQALIEAGLADNRVEALEQLIDMGELDENGESWDDNQWNDWQAENLSS